MRYLVLIVLLGVIASLDAAEPAPAKPQLAKLAVAQPAANSNFLRFQVPAGVAAPDRLWMVYALAPEKTKPQDCILEPRGMVDPVLKEMQQKVAGFKFKLGALHVPFPFPNGDFEFCSTTNGDGKRGIYALAQVLGPKKPDDTRDVVGTCVTYYDIAGWSTQQAGTLEIPLPGQASDMEEERLPRTCNLAIWLVDKNNVRLAFGIARVKRN